MSEIKSHETNPLPGIDYSEIHIPDENILGTGIFTTVLESKAIAKINPIISSIINVPIFQLMVSINSVESEITVLLGKADNSPALSRKIFILPKKFDISNKHQFDVIFKDWEIKDLKMNGNKLQIAD